MNLTVEELAALRKLECRPLEQSSNLVSCEVCSAVGRFLTPLAHKPSCALASLIAKVETYLHEGGR